MRYPGNRTGGAAYPAAKMSALRWLRKEIVSRELAGCDLQRNKNTILSGGVIYEHYHYWLWPLGLADCMVP